MAKPNQKTETADKGLFAKLTRPVLPLLFVSTLLVVAIEILSRGSLISTLGFFFDFYRPAWTTVALFALLMLGLDAIIGRPLQSAILVVPVALLLVWIGEQKSRYLGDPLYPTDFLYGRQIAELLPLLVRDRPLAALAIIAATVAIIALLVLLWRRWPRRFPKLSFNARIARLAIAVPALAFFVSIMDYSTFSWTRDRLRIIPMMWDQKENYAFNGFAMAFALNVPMANVPAPADYSAKAMDAIATSAEGSLATPAEKPDIIIVMSESFWDPTLLPGVKISPDPMPTTRKLTSGHVFSPEFGGMTANVEFEALTGFSNAFLPYGSIPYQQYIRQPVPSLASFFRTEGYRTEAIHPGASWFWNRKVVYEAFGFDEFLSEETLPPMTLRGPLASDSDFTDEIMRRADASAAPLFLFAVSLQNHGPYAPNRYASDSVEVTAPSISAGARGSIRSYAEGIADADQGLARLIDWASQRPRPTIIAFFGDHLPPLGPAYVETGLLKEPVAPRNGPPEAMATDHETPFVLWSNRKGSVADIGAVSPAFIPLHVLEAAGMRHPYYTDFLGSVHERYRVVDRNMLVKSDGAAVTGWARADEIDPLLRDYKLVQYDILFGDMHSRKRLFPKPASPVIETSRNTPPSLPELTAPGSLNHPG